MEREKYEKNEISHSGSLSSLYAAVRGFLTEFDVSLLSIKAISALSRVLSQDNQHKD